MHKTWKIWLFAVALLLTACQAQAEPESTAVEVETVVVGASVTAVPDTPAPPNTPAPTETAIIAPTETQETAVVSPAEQEESSDAIASPVGQTVNDYTNVSYTQADADLIGKTNRPQFVLTYATW